MRRILNQFGQVKFDPSGSTCQNIPYAFHPMYATSSEATGVVWASDSSNVSFSDELGHFEYCGATSGPGGNCTAAGVGETSGLDGDDQYCFTSAVGARSNQLSGCQSNDTDFEGSSYQNDWPGTIANPRDDARLHAQPIAFSSPLFRGPGGNGLENYSRVAFESDLALQEWSGNSPNNNCQIEPTDPNPGSGCVFPPNGGSFYPFYSMLHTPLGCVWLEGGAYLPGADYSLGSTASQVFGPVTAVQLPFLGRAISLYYDFRRDLSTNPCPATTPSGG